MRDDVNRRRYTFMAALAAIAVVAVLSMYGSWSPRIVQRDDPAGAAIAIVIPTTPTAPETAPL